MITVMLTKMKKKETSYTFMLTILSISSTLGFVAGIGEHAINILCKIKISLKASNMIRRCGD